jgi:hypothetical protein
VILALFSCRKGGYEGTGYLTVSVGMEDPELVVKSPETPSEDMVFSLSIVGEDGIHSYTVEDARTLATEPLAVAAGRYTVTATTGIDTAANWGSAYYSGSTTILVKPEQTATARIVTTLANTMVTVEFEDPIPDVFNNYRVTVDNGAGQALVFSKADNTVGNTAYFAVTGTLNYELSMVNADGATYHDGPHAITGVKANQHYHFKFSLSDDTPTTGGFVLTIIVDEDTVYSEYEMKLDFGADGKPVTTTSFPLTNDITLIEGNDETRTVSFEASRGIGSLVISHNDAGLTALGLPRWTDLVTSQDLSAIRATGIVCNSVDFGTTDVQVIDLTSFISHLPVGSYKFQTTLVDTRNAYNMVNYNITIIPPVESRAVSATPWARFAILEGVWYTVDRPASLKVQYRKTTSSTWLDADSYVTYNEATKTIKAEIWSLDAGTSYVFRTVTDNDIAKDQTGEVTLPVLSFTTIGTPTVPNLNFDSWYKDGDAWMPNSSSSNHVWDSANKGTASFGVVPTVPEESDVVAGKAARLTGSTAMGQFAAGNIYIGKFAKVSGVGAEIDWGYGFNGKPLALKGYYKYNPQPINKTQAPYNDMNGQTDICSIEIYLVNWTSQFHINTSKKQFLSKDDPSIIGYGAMYSNVNDSAYKSFTIPIQYRRTNETPTYIVIACSASRYADYFTGGIGSMLKIDEFELVYDPAQLNASERELVGYRN